MGFDIIDIMHNAFYKIVSDEVAKKFPNQSFLLSYNKNTYTIQLNINHINHTIDMAELRKNLLVTQFVDEAASALEERNSLVNRIVSSIETILKEVQSRPSLSENSNKTGSSTRSIGLSAHQEELQNNYRKSPYTNQSNSQLADSFNDFSDYNDLPNLGRDHSLNISAPVSNYIVNYKPIDFEKSSPNPLFTPRGFEFDVRFLLAMPVVLMALVYFGLKRKKNTAEAVTKSVDYHELYSIVIAELKQKIADGALLPPMEHNNEVVEEDDNSSTHDAEEAIEDNNSSNHDAEEAIEDNNSSNHDAEEAVGEEDHNSLNHNNDIQAAYRSFFNEYQILNLGNSNGASEDDDDNSSILDMEEGVEEADYNVLHHTNMVPESEELFITSSNQLDENTISSFYVWLTSPTTPEFLAMLALVAGLALLTAAIATAALTGGVGTPAACLLAVGGVAAIMGGIGLYRNRGGNGGDAGPPRYFRDYMGEGAPPANNNPALS